MYLPYLNRISVNISYRSRIINQYHARHSYKKILQGCIPDSPIPPHPTPTLPYQTPTPQHHTNHPTMHHTPNRPPYPSPTHQNTKEPNVTSSPPLPTEGGSGTTLPYGGGHDVQHRHSKKNEISQPPDHYTIEPRSRCRGWTKGQPFPYPDKIAHYPRPLYHRT